MSGIAKPCIRSSTSTTPNQVIQVEDIQSMDKIDIQTDPNGVVPKSAGILFTMKPGSAQGSIHLKYPGAYSASVILRDASFLAIETAISAVVV